jgi:hypothetical protein
MKLTVFVLCAALGLAPSLPAVTQPDPTPIAGDGLPAQSFPTPAPSPVAGRDDPKPTPATTPGPIQTAITESASSSAWANIGWAALVVGVVVAVIVIISNQPRGGSPGGSSSGY